MNIQAELRALSQPAFNLELHLSRSAEVRTFDLTTWMRPRQPINVVRSTCAKLRRPL
jgi:hypothetical protein